MQVSMQMTVSEVEWLAIENADRVDGFAVDGDRMEAWATERGIVLFNPRDSEYRQLIEQQDA